MINRCITIITGRLGKDPEIWETQSGKKKATLTVAVDFGWGDRRETEWFYIVVWDKTAEFADNYLHKGDIVSAQGAFRSREYESNGDKKRVWELRATDLQAIYGRGNDDYPVVSEEDGDLPF